MRPISSHAKSFTPALVSRRVVRAAALCSVSLLFFANGCISRTLTALSVQPATGLTCVIPGVSAQFKAYGTYTESGHATVTTDLTDIVSWSAVIPTVAAVNSSGLVTGLGLGQTSILATTQGEFGNLTATSDIQVKSSCTTASAAPARTLTGITILPASQTVSSPGEKAQFLAIGTYSSAPWTADVTDQVKWQSANPAVAVSRSGLVTPATPGESTITATGTGSNGNLIPANAHIGYAASTAAPMLTVHEVGSGTGAVTGTTGIDCEPGLPAGGCTAQVSAGTAVTLSATPKPGSVFEGWSANCLPAANGDPQSCTVTASGSTHVAAIFDPQ